MLQFALPVELRFVPRVELRSALPVELQYAPWAVLQSVLPVELRSAPLVELLSEQSVSPQSGFRFWHCFPAALLLFSLTRAVRRERELLY